MKIIWKRKENLMTRSGSPWLCFCRRIRWPAPPASSAPGQSARSGLRSALWPISRARHKVVGFKTAASVSNYENSKWKYCRALPADHSPMHYFITGAKSDSALHHFLWPSRGPRCRLFPDPLTSPVKCPPGFVSPVL